MKLDRCGKLCAFIVLMLSIGSTCISAVILSSETLNVEPTPSSTDENVLQKPIVASSDIISDRISDFRPETERNNEHSDEIIKSDSIEQDNSRIDEILPEKETSLPQLDVADSIKHEHEASKEHIPDDNTVQNVPTPTPIAVEGASKDILIETPIVGNIENVIADAINETVLLQKHVVSSSGSAIEDDTIQQSDSLPEPVPTEVNRTESADGIKDELNLTVEENQIPVFSEWAQKRLEEVEKEVEQEAVNTSTMKKNMPTANSKAPVLKLKNSKNYASPDCGAKIIAANSESSGTGYVLTSTRDEYLLSPCKSRIWFVVELCEAIQAERIDLANFELFSSSPKNFSVGVSSRFPTRDWSNVGKFIAKDERYIQSFDLYPHLFGKYVRVDIHSHYNSEHFCPISLFRVYGTSEFEAFETENRQHPIDDMDDDDEDDQESDTIKSKSNIFKSASDAVMSIVDTVKKAASFVKHNGNKTTENNSHNDLNTNLSTDHCISPNHAINCENCPDDMAREVTALVECKQNLLNRLLSIDVIRNSLYKSQICNDLIGSELNINCSELTDANRTTSKQLTDLQMDYINHLFSLKYITAMCNLLAAADRRVAFNSTIPVHSDLPINVTIDKKGGDELLPSEQLNTKPIVQIEENDQTVGASTESNAENLPQVEQTSPRPESAEKSSEVETTDGQTDNYDKESTTASVKIPSAVESSEDAADKAGQNIFNVVEPIEPSTDTPTAVATEAPVTEPTTTSNEQDSLPSIIILPETTTPTPPDLAGDSSEEQASNGWTNTPQFGQKLHSESVFLRLSNRVKALERNMSLSGQYLEELSRRYKKQVEELQLSFAKTLVNIEEQSRRNLERKQELFEQNQKLRNDLEILTERIFSWRNILICCICFTCVQILIFHLILRIWDRKYGVKQNISTEATSDATSSVDTLNRKRKSGNVPVKFRRKSAEEKRERNVSESSSCALLRRPSTEALNITGTYRELLIDDSKSTHNSFSVDDHELQSGDKCVTDESHEADISGYVKIEDLKELYDKPDDEYEFYGPAPDLNRDGSGSQGDECGSETTIDSSTDGLQSKKTKTNRNKYKSRRLSSPSFFKSPFSSGSAAQSTGWEWHRSKKSKNSSQFNNKKAKSESPPSLKQNGVNNNCTPPNNNNKHVDNQKITRTDPTRSSISSSIDDRKTSGSFKRILKKIF